MTTSGRPAIGPGRVDAARADALWRAIVYVAVAQLHINRDPLTVPVQPDQLKARPAGHWGTVPGTAWLLVHLALAGGRHPDLDLVPILGAGHAGIVQSSLAWLTGDLAKAVGRFTRDLAGLNALVCAFPDLDGIGAEVNPRLPGGGYQGGWLGGAFAFAQGAALDGGRLTVPLLGDGECETPTTAAAWLAAKALPNCLVLPMIHLNGARMGGRSLLGAMSDDEIEAWALGSGWTAIVVAVDDVNIEAHTHFGDALDTAIVRARRGDRVTVVMRCAKGFTGPPGAHKTPLTEIATDPQQRAQLNSWLASYRADELFNARAEFSPSLDDALDHIRLGQLRPARAPADIATWSPAGGGFSNEVTSVLLAHAAAGDLRVMCPDELTSNRLGSLCGLPWVHEVLAEEVCVGWLSGWTAAGGRGLLISYEAFAPLMLTSLIGQLKQRRLSDTPAPSLNVLLTSYGWHNTYTHGDPSLITALLATSDPAVHVFTPADAGRLGAALDAALRSYGQVNIIVAGKHPIPAQPLTTLVAERASGMSVWPDMSDSQLPRVTLACAGDLPAALATEAASAIRTRFEVPVRVVNVNDLTALRGGRLRDLAGESAVVIMTLGHSAAVWGLLGPDAPARCRVVGWREAPNPMSQRALATHAGLTVAGILRTVAELLGQPT